MPVFPFLDSTEIQIPSRNELPLAKEWAWDFKELDFAMRDGKMYQVEGKRAVEIWIWKALMTQRYRYLIYTWDYGNELESLIGQGYTSGLVKAEAERYIKEGLESLGGYITGVEDVNVSIDEGKLNLEFAATTPYGEVKVFV